MTLEDEVYNPHFSDGMNGWEFQRFHTRLSNYKENKETETKLVCQLKSQMTDREPERTAGLDESECGFPRDHPLEGIAKLSS